MQSAALHGVFWLKPVFYVAVAFVLFFVIFGRKLAVAVNGTLDGRIATIRQELDEAARLRREAEAMLADAQAQRRAAIAAAEILLASAQDEARRLSNSLEAEARTAAERRERMALDRIESAENSVTAELRTAAIGIAGAATQQILAATLTQDDDAALIDRSIAALPTALRAA